MHGHLLQSRSNARREESTGSVGAKGGRGRAGGGSSRTRGPGGAHRRARGSSLAMWRVGDLGRGTGMGEGRRETTGEARAAMSFTTTGARRARNGRRVETGG